MENDDFYSDNDTLEDIINKQIKNHNISKLKNNIQFKKGEKESLKRVNKSTFIKTSRYNNNINNGIVNNYKNISL